jgi:biopolymer transport protein ExbD
MNIIPIFSISIIILIIIIIYLILLITQNKSTINLEKLNTVEKIVSYAVKYSEQMYINDASTQRYQLSLDYIYNALKLTDIKYGDVIKIIKGIIESQVYVLPKTHIQ